MLAAQPSSNLPVGTQLTVRDELQVLEAPVLTEHTKDYIYAQVIGAYNEQFFVTIHFPNGTAITLPPFHVLLVSLGVIYHAAIIRSTGRTILSI